MWEQGARVQIVSFLSSHFFYSVLFILLCPDRIDHSKWGSNYNKGSQKGELGKYSRMEMDLKG